MVRAWHFAAVIMGLVLGGGRSVSEYCDWRTGAVISAPVFAGLTSLHSPTHPYDEGNDSYPPFGKREEQDYVKSKQKSSQTK